MKRENYILHEFSQHWEQYGVYEAHILYMKYVENVGI